MRVDQVKCPDVERLFAIQAKPDKSANLWFQFKHLQRHKQQYVLLVFKTPARVSPSLVLTLDFDADTDCWTTPAVDL